MKKKRKKEKKEKKRNIHNFSCNFLRFLATKHKNIKIKCTQNPTLENSKYQTHGYLRLTPKPHFPNPNSQKKPNP